MPSDPSPRFRALVEQTRSSRRVVRNLVDSGHWRAAEPVTDRARASDRARATVLGGEAVQGFTDDLQQACFLFEGARARRAVAFVEVDGAQSSKTGSGFMISPRLFLTNYHVIGSATEAVAAQVTFDREWLANGRPSPTTSFLLDPDAFALFSPVDKLDFALIAIGEKNSGAGTLADFGYCPLSNSPDRHRIGMSVNIVQHPHGRPKMIAIRNNLLTHRTNRTLLYETDTDHGSSGSPVFNDLWEIVALHHWGFPFLEKKDEDGNNITNNVNEGVRISVIYDNLAARAKTLSGRQRDLLDEALAFSRQQQTLGERALSPPRPEAPDPANTTQTPESRGEAAMALDNQIRLTIPLEILVRVAGQAAPVTRETAAVPPVKALTRGAEAVSVDADYSSRTGYDPEFLSGYVIDLPVPNATLIKQIAPLRASEQEAASGILRYEHFSVVMNKTRRIAIFTATNVDGTTYLEVDRDTGAVKDGEEGDKWFKDPRISESFWTGQDFYKEWSTYFDRGHLTRRTDPTWGTDEQAERANADTFHWTNCSPQHFRFNQTTPFWQGAERYVLENGLLTHDARKRIVVFQGPIFDAKIDLYADDLQIPSSFFKIIVWPGASGLKAVGLVVDQLSLLSESRRNLGKPTDVKSVNVAHWRAGIDTIERRTGLDFGATVRAADTIKAGAQPNVGGEAAIRVASLADILR